MHSIKLSLKGIRAAKLFEIAKYIAVNSGALYDPSSALAFLRLYGMISYTNHTAEGSIIMKAPKGKYAWTATVGEKGQIVIPKQAREIFNIKPGDTILLLGDEKRGIAIPPKGAFAHLMEAAFQEAEDE
ncbi:AbrB/MazE/SpoVT family DNA-binding domain-containing protein [Oribacterium sp. oral taxon 078]|uniref:AbrB/MazE/SpoVT family DNA-binding domain-containing protein n=1 Tax=Oribacterium sp. oral taxon 078 TaxID=652706 RepID=UPI002E8DFD8B|nr:AbrB/MazE/SpoVT family DNA-binding domain-containing protein [Oribacterium sp. oral taxon 078]